MLSRVALIGDLLLIAEEQLTIPAKELLRRSCLDSDPSLAALVAGFQGTDPSLVEEAALCAAWIVRHSPFPEENQPIAYRLLCTMLDEAELPWRVPEDDIYVVTAVFRALEAGAISEAEFVDWVRLRVATA